MTSTSGNILVTCATGSLGVLTMNFLLSQKQAPAKTLFASVRDPKKPVAVAMAKKGVTVRQGDFTDVSSMTTSMAGIHTLMFISSGSLDKRVVQHKNVLEAAKRAKVRHIVYTSFLKASKSSKFALAPDHIQTEDEIKKTGIPYTIFRNSFYMDLIPGMLGNALEVGKWNYPVGNSKVNFVARPDIAEGLARVLVNLAPHVNKIYEIASKKSYTMAEITAILTKIKGKTITYNACTLDTFKAGLKDLGLSDFDFSLVLSVVMAISAGQLEITDPALENILGHPPKTLEEYLPVVFKKK